MRSYETHKGLRDVPPKPPEISQEQHANAVLSDLYSYGIKQGKSATEVRDIAEKHASDVDTKILGTNMYNEANHAQVERTPGTMASKMKTETSVYQRLLRGKKIENEYSKAIERYQERLDLAHQKHTNLLNFKI